MREVLTMLASLAALGPLAAAQDFGGGRSFGGRQVRGGGAAVWKTLVEKYDKNRDGEITKEEHGRTEASFRSLDRNRDGVLSEDDFSSGGRRGAGRGRRGGRGNFDPSRMIGGMLARPADKNGDQKTTKKEFDALVKATDADGDLILTADELADALDSGGNRRGRGLSRMLPRMLDRLDADGDGDVQVKEILGLFAKLDLDRNGALEGDELGRRRGRGNRGGRRGSGNAPKVGSAAPDFELPMLAEKKKAVKLSSFAGQKPVALIFGSYT